MDSISLSSSMIHRRQPLPLTSPRRRRPSSFRKVVAASGGTNGRDYVGRIVDEGMIVLRMRIREMKMLESSQTLPPEWAEWEKQYYAHYITDVCEALGLLQSKMMNTRPCLALGMVALLMLSVPVASAVVIFHAMEIAKGIFLSGLFHLS